MSEHTDVLRVRIEADDNGQLHASLARAAKDVDDLKKSTDGVAPAVKKASDGLQDLEKSADKVGGAIVQNSRAITSFQDLLDDLTSGQLGRAKRELSALANETGLLAHLFNPLGLAIGGAAIAAGIFAAAIMGGEKETEAFDKALIMTGHYAGETSGQLQDMAKSLDDLQGVTEHAAAGVIAQVTQTGKFYGSMVKDVSATALLLQQTTGQSIDKTISQFEQLGRDPVNGILKLNDSMHFLTQSVYDQITALVQRGQKDQAAQVAQTAYADAMQSRARDVKESLGLLETGWDDVKNAAKEAWDAMLDIGRPTTLDDKIKSLRSTIAQEQKLLAAGGVTTVHSISTPYGASLPMTVHLNTDTIKANIAQLQDQLNKDLGQAMFGPEAEQRKQALMQRATDKALNAQAALGSGAGLSRQEQLQARLNDLIAQKNQALFGVTDAGQRQQITAHFNNQVAAAARAYNTGGHAGATNTHADAALDSFSQYVTGLSNRSNGQQYDDAALGKYVSGVEKLYQEFGKAVKAGADVTQATAEYDRGIKALGADLAKTREQQARADDAYSAQLDQQLALRKQAIDLQVQSVGMGAKEIQRMQQLNQVQQEFTRQRAQLNRELDQGSISTTQYDTRLAKLKQDEAATTTDMVQGFARLDAAMGDWHNGAIRAMEDMRDQFADVAGQMAQTFRDAFANMNQAIANWVETGKFNGQQFADNLIGDLTEIELHVAESRILSSFLGSIISSGAGIANNYMAGGGATYAAGGVDWNVNIGGARASGGPTDAGRIYEVAENGKPELYSANGRTYLLGATDGYVSSVQRPGSSGIMTDPGAGMQRTAGGVQVIVENHSDSQAQVQQSTDANGNDVIKVIVGQAVTAVNNGIARGGSTYKVLQQTFGLNRRGVPVAGG